MTTFRIVKIVYALLALLSLAALAYSLLHGRWFPAFAYVMALVTLGLLLSAQVRAARERFIREQPLPSFLKAKLRMQHAGFTAKDGDLVEAGLRQFFWANARSRGQFVAMPSKVADEMWHEFILHTRAYDAWCKRAFGKLLHHTPAIALGPAAAHNDGLRRAWFWACKDEGIDPRLPTRLPLLFALDRKLAIAGGFHYVPDCNDIARKSDAGGDGGVLFCGTAFSDASGASGDASDFGGADAGHGSGDASGDGGADGGGGCGGGGD
ncbi:MAG: hypothetical protein KGJ44_10820 [Betaproteobacteria bacterium]|nr:hypothetical protein [Betaproteobacteria bacterium]